MPPHSPPHPIRLCEKTAHTLEGTQNARVFSKKEKKKERKKNLSIFTRGTRSEHVVKAVNVTLTRKLWTQSEDFNFPALSQRMILEVWRSRSHRESGCSQCEASPPLTPTPRSICRFTATSYSRQEFGLLCPLKYSLRPTFIFPASLGRRDS